MLKLFRDIMQREQNANNMDVEYESFTPPVTKEKRKKRKKLTMLHSKLRFDDKNEKSGSSESLFKKHGDYDESKNHRLFKDNRRQQVIVNNAEVHSDKTRQSCACSRPRLPSSSGSCSGSCQLKKILGNEYICIGVIFVLFIISCFAAHSLLTPDRIVTRTYVAKEPRFRLTDDEEGSTDNNNLKRSAFQAGNDIRPGLSRDVRRSVLEQDNEASLSDFGSHDLADMNPVSEIDRKMEHSSILDPQQVEDDNFSPELKQFYHKLMETEEQIRNLKNGLYRNNYNHFDSGKENRFKRSFFRTKEKSKMRRKKLKKKRKEIISACEKRNNTKRSSSEKRELRREFNKRSRNFVFVARNKQFLNGSRSLLRRGHKLKKKKMLANFNGSHKTLQIPNYLQKLNHTSYNDTKYTKNNNRVDTRKMVNLNNFRKKPLSDGFIIKKVNYNYNGNRNKNKLLRNRSIADISNDVGEVIGATEKVVNKDLNIYEPSTKNYDKNGYINNLPMKNYDKNGYINNPSMHNYNKNGHINNPFLKNDDKNGRQTRQDKDKVIEPNVVNDDDNINQDENSSNDYKRVQNISKVTHNIVETADKNVQFVDSGDLATWPKLLHRAAYNISKRPNNKLKNVSCIDSNKSPFRQDKPHSIYKDNVNNLGLRSRRLLSIEEVSVTPKEETEHKDTEAVTITSSTYEAAQDYNKTLTKRNAENNTINHLNATIVKRSIYDELSPVHTTPSNESTNISVMSKSLLKKSSAWFQDKMKRISERIQKTSDSFRNMTKKNNEKDLIRITVHSTDNRPDKLHSLKKRELFTSGKVTRQTDIKKTFKQLTKHMKNICKEASEEVQRTRENVQDDPESTVSRGILQNLVKLMSNMVDYQVHHSTCLSLPADLREFLEWLTTPTKVSQVSERVSKPKSHRVPFYDLPIQSDYRAKEWDAQSGFGDALNQVEDLKTDYLNLSDEDKNKLTGIKEYLEDQKEFLNKQINNEK